MVKSELINKKERYSNYELLRILAMFSIICFHFSDHGVISVDSVPLSFNRIVLEILRIGGGFGNCIFVLLCGYFLVDSTIKKKKIIKLYSQVFFYSVILGLLAMYLGILPLSFENIKNIIFPITYNQYWWFSNYFILIILSPFLNKMIKKFNKKELMYLSIILFVICSILPTFINKNTFYSDLGFFINLYLIGAILKKVNFKKLENIKNCLFLSIVTLIICIISILICDKINFPDIYKYVWPMNKVPIVFLSISIFFLFKNLKIKTNKLINTAASTTFGIYLIHMNPYIWTIFWVKLFNNSVYFLKWYFPFVVLIQCIMVFILCGIIEYLRNKLFMKLPYIKKVYENN